jgi:hypothetical protein
MHHQQGNQYGGLFQREIDSVTFWTFNMLMTRLSSRRCHKGTCFV